MSRERASLRGSSSYPSQKFPPPVVLLDSGARAYSLGSGEPSEANLEDLLALGETTSTMSVEMTSRHIILLLRGDTNRELKYIDYGVAQWVAILFLVT